MLYTEPRVIAKPKKLGRFDNFDQQDRADLNYGGQQAKLQALVQKAPEQRATDTIPAPETPPSR